MRKSSAAISLQFGAARRRLAWVNPSLHAGAGRARCRAPPSHNRTGACAPVASGVTFAAPARSRRWALAPNDIPGHALRPATAPSASVVAPVPPIVDALADRIARAILPTSLRPLAPTGASASDGLTRGTDAVNATCTARAVVGFVARIRIIRTARALLNAAAIPRATPRGIALSHLRSACDERHRPCPSQSRHNSEQYYGRISSRSPIPTRVRRRSPWRLFAPGCL